MQPNFLEQAKRMWSHSRIEGSGKFAAVLACSYRVVLCDMALEAEALVSQPCCAHCNPAPMHKLVELIVPVASAYRRNNSLHRMMQSED
jgi:hypothetical protein